MHAAKIFDCLEKITAWTPKKNLFMFSLLFCFFSSQTVDMLYFLLIMVIFLLAYGVAQQAILYPNEAASWSMLSRILFRPYFQVYGELFVDPPDTRNYFFFVTISISFS